MNKLLLASLLFLISCNQFYKRDELLIKFENTLKVKFTLESNFGENKQYTTGDIVTRPPGSWQNLIYSRNFCLNYKIPAPEATGVLQIVHKNKDHSCPKLPTRKELSSIVGISNLRIKYITDHIKGKTVRNGVYGISIEYSFYETKRKVSLTLPNKLRGSSYIKSNLNKYSSSGTFRRDKGVRITEASRKQLRTSLWPSSREGEVVFCEKKNSRCKIVGASTCHECLYGWEYLVDYSCDRGGSKACSPVQCGEKGHPACPRGVIWSGSNMSDLCFDDSPAGYCEEDLKVICGEDGVLICV